ncbi:MAG: hypothetical protein KBB51_01815 [Candidatus Moranbacteria bacterium]|jgi:uncharacterized membrane protein YhdT|nr:hypothetical protein [Candidatus Moranbacteria bacterium]
MTKFTRLFFDSSQEVSGALSLTLIFLIAFVVAWFSVTAGKNIVDHAKYSPSLGLRAESLNAEINR